MASVYMTAKRSKDVTEAVAASDAHLGIESSRQALPGHDPVFVDFPFTDPDADFQDHLEVVKQTRPRLTVSPDIEGGRTLSGVVDKADRLLEYSESVIIVPKTVRPSEVPDRFRVGVPLANYGSGAPWNLWDYQDCSELHLLGGGPPRQLRVRGHLPATIESVDTATLGQRCRFGMWDGGSCDAPDGWDYRRRLKVSLDNYAEAWR